MLPRLSLSLDRTNKKDDRWFFLFFAAPGSGTRPGIFMMVSALMGRERMQAAYAHAIEHGYRS